MSLRPSLRQAAKCALASGLAWEASRWLGASRPVFAVLAVLVTMQSSAYGSLTKGLERLVGVFAGVALGALALRVTGLGGLSVSGLMLLATLVGGFVSFGGAFNTQVGISALLLVASGGMAYGATRAWETAVGGLVGVLITALVWPSDPRGRLSAVLDATSLHLGADVVAVGEAAGGAPARAERLVRQIRRHAAAAEAAVADLPEAEQALRWLLRVWPGDADIERTESRLSIAATLYRHVRTLSRYVLEAVRAGSVTGRGRLLEAARAVAAACPALRAGAAAEDARGAAAWLSAADEALSRYWDESRVDAAVSAPVMAEFRHLLADMRRALAAVGGDDSPDGGGGGFSAKGGPGFEPRGPARAPSPRAGVPRGTGGEADVPRPPPGPPDRSAGESRRTGRAQSGAGGASGSRGAPFFADGLGRKGFRVRAEMGPHGGMSPTTPPALCALGRGRPCAGRVREPAALGWRPCGPSVQRAFRAQAHRDNDAILGRALAGRVGRWWDEPSQCVPQALEGSI